MLTHGTYRVRCVRSNDGWTFRLIGASLLSGWVRWLDDVEPASKGLIAEQFGLDPAGFDIRLIVGREALSHA